MPKKYKANDSQNAKIRFLRNPESNIEQLQQKPQLSKTGYNPPWLIFITAVLFHVLCTHTQILNLKVTDCSLLHMDIYCRSMSGTGRSCHKYNFCHNKHMCLSQEKMCFVTKKSMLVATNVCCDKTCLLLQQKYACHDKTFVVFVTTKMILVAAPAIDKCH